jgi:integrase/recombinase XerD
MCSWAVVQGRIPYNPLAAAKSVRTKSKRSTAPNEDEVGRLLAHADDTLRVVILCAADSGLRRGEILGLRWEWIDRDEMMIRLPAWICKSGRARTTPLTQRTLDAMDVVPRHLRSSYLLTNPRTGEQYSDVTITSWFRAMALRSGVQAAPGEKVVMHSLRHGFATNAVRRGVRLDVVSDWLGHASLDQTRDYIEVVDVDVAEGRAIFEAGIVKEQARRGPKRISAAAPDSNDDEKSKSGGK